jgi:hypothetical protein
LFTVGAAFVCSQSVLQRELFTVLCPLYCHCGAAAAAAAAQAGRDWTASSATDRILGTHSGVGITSLLITLVRAKLPSCFVSVGILSFIVVSLVAASSQCLLPYCYWRVACCGRGCCCNF